MPLATVAIVREPTVTVIARPHFVEPSHLPVQWVGVATDGERVAEFAGRLRHMSQANPAGRTSHEYLENVIAQGQAGVFDHAHYALLFEGVSQSLAHELLRHSAAFATVQLSQRALDDGASRFVLPPAMIGDGALERAWTAQIEAAIESYVALVSALMTRYAWVDDKVHRRRMARDAAHGVLPQSTETRILMTGSARAWRTMVAQHVGEDEALEIRRLAVAVLRVMQTEVPVLFGDVEIYMAADRRQAARMGSRQR